MLYRSFHSLLVEWIAAPAHANECGALCSDYSVKTCEKEYLGAIS